MMHLIWMPFYILLGLISAFAVYYFFFAIVYLLVPPEMLPHSPRQHKFLIIVPAHNEERLISRTLRHLSTVNYPRHLFKVAVIADNCNDSTAAIASQYDVLVVERQDAVHVGKGFAISWALVRLPLSEYDAVVMIDADSIIDAEYLVEMNNSLCAGHHVIQGYNDLLNPNDNYLTRLMHVTSVMKNLLFNEGRARLGLSVALMGTGMCFEKKVLEEIGWGAHSIGEDWEYFAKLTERDIPVHFQSRAKTYSEEAKSLRQGFSQRLRWMGGRFETIARYVIPILWQGLRHGSPWKMEAVLCLAPPYSQLAYLTVFSVWIAFFYPLEVPGKVLRIIAISVLGMQMVYFMLGLIVMRASAKTIISVIVSPVFLSWRVIVDVLALVGYRRTDWVRTDRNVQDIATKL